MTPNDDRSRTSSNDLGADELIGVIARPVVERLEHVLDRESERWIRIDPDLGPPLAALARLVLGDGKRLRPAFCYWAYVGAGGDPSSPAIVDAGAGFELLHAFALMHDDVMDGSDRRRGIETIHVEFAGRHEQEAWRGEARRFGEGVAILVGDLAAVYADQLLAGAPDEVARIWSEMKIELNVGQFLDVVGTARGRVALEPARRISRLKSGKYTIERPLELGAALAGGSPSLRAALAAYGEPLGEAFQLRDDLLGTFGDPARTGKPVGDDLREGKPTPLLAHAIARCDGTDAEILARVGAPGLTEVEVAEMQDVLARSGARDEVEQAVRDLTRQAVAALDDVPATPEATHALAALARRLAERDH